MGIKTFGVFVVGGLTALCGKAVYDNVLKKSGVDVKIKAAFSNLVHKNEKDCDKKVITDSID